MVSKGLRTDKAVWNGGKLAVHVSNTPQGCLAAAKIEPDFCHARLVFVLRGRHRFKLDLHPSKPSVAVFFCICGPFKPSTLQSE